MLLWQLLDIPNQPCDKTFCTSWKRKTSVYVRLIYSKILNIFLKCKGKDYFWHVHLLSLVTGSLCGNNDYYDHHLLRTYNVTWVNTNLSTHKHPTKSIWLTSFSLLHLIKRDCPSYVQQTFWHAHTDERRIFLFCIHLCAKILDQEAEYH